MFRKTPKGQKGSITCKFPPVASVFLLDLYYLEQAVFPLALVLPVDPATSTVYDSQ